MALYQGFFKPKNPDKYKGDPTNIIYRSGWELKLMIYLDNHKDILKWSSEEIIVPYRSPIDGRIHRYFPDFIVKVKKKDGQVMTHVIEVKPEHQTKAPTQKKKTKKFLEEQATFIINQSKWKAASEFCKDHGWKFQVLTEKDLGIL